MNGDGAVSGPGPRDGVLENLHRGRLPSHGLEVERGEVVGTLPLLLVRGHVVHDERHPPAEDEHAAVDEGGGVERAGKGRGAVDDGLRPGHRVDVQDPQVTQSEGRNVEMLTQHRSTNYKLELLGVVVSLIR